jgi:hypothetical protein
MKTIIVILFSITGAVTGYFLGKGIMYLFKAGGATMIRPLDVFWCYILPAAVLGWLGWLLGEYITQKKH